MTLERSDKLALTAREAGEKYDYFMAGLCAAIVGYLAPSFHPTQLVLLSPTSLEIVSLTAFVVAAIAAFRRLEALAHHVRVNAELLHSQEMRGELIAASSDGQPVFNQATGDVYSQDELRLRIEHHSKLARNAREVLQTIDKRLERRAQARNWLLLIGVVLLVGARLWAAL